MNSTLLLTFIHSTDAKSENLMNSTLLLTFIHSTDMDSYFGTIQLIDVGFSNCKQR